MAENLKWKQKKEKERYLLFNYQLRSMVVKLSIVIAVSFFISSFSEKKEKDNGAPYRITFEKDLFESEEILSITLKGNIRQLLNDRADKPASHSITLSYRDKDSSEVSIPVQMKTR